MAQNTATITDADGQFEDWIELFNPTDNTISLDNLYMTDTATNLTKWAFPSGLTIEPQGYLTVWADQDLTQSGLHADFKLSAGGESVILAYANGTIIETVDFGAQTADMGYARIPNGTGNFVIQSPTYNFNNELLSVSEVEFKRNLTLFPNPTNGNVTLSNAAFDLESVAIYNLQGQLLFQNQYQNQRDIALDLSSFSKGVYLAVVNKNTNIKIIKN
jgi:hypothetical protein